MPGAGERGDGNVKRAGLLATGLVLFLSSLLAAQEPGVRLAQPQGGGGATIGRPISPADRPLLDPKNNRLDQLLLLWEQRMKNVESIHVVNCTRIDKEKSGAVKTWRGEARYLKPNYAAIRLEQEEDRQFVEMMISTGTYLYEYRPQFKKLVIHDLPPPRHGQFDSNLLTFLFGMSAAEAKQRYELTLTKDIDETNKHYIYIEVLPRFPEDKKEFTRAQLVLFASTMLPRRLWFEQPNGNQIQWDLPNMDTETRLRPSDFQAPPPPPGWETQRIHLPQQTPARPEDQPRVVRPSRNG